MCFYDEGDWCAALSDVSEGPTDKPATCIECGAAIAIGENRKHVFQQEDEECRRCEFDDLDDDEEPCVQHDYGNVFECDVCEVCIKILRAIEAVEADEGCPVYARQPLVGELRDAIQCDNEDKGRYAARALEMFPELSSVEWLKK